MGLMRLSNKSRRGVSLVGKPIKMVSHLTGIPDPNDFVDLDPAVKDKITRVLKSLVRDVNRGTLTRKKIPSYSQELLNYEEATQGAQTRYDTEGL